MRRLHRLRPRPMPANQREALALPDRHDHNMLHRAAIRKQLALPHADTHGQIAPDTGPIFPVVAVLGHKGYLDPLADGVVVSTIQLPEGLGSRPISARNGGVMPR
jgi:hypothetical protein